MDIGAGGASGAIACSLFTHQPVDCGRRVAELHAADVWTALVGNAERCVETIG